MSLQQPAALSQASMPIASRFSPAMTASCSTGEAAASTPTRSAPTALPELARHPAVREHVRRSIAQWNAGHPGSSECVARVLLLSDAPSIDANEITDKGYINQRLALERRKADVARLFATKPDADVIVITPTAP